MLFTHKTCQYKVNLGQSINTKNMHSEAQPSNLVSGAHEPIWNMMYAFPVMDEQSDFQESEAHKVSSMDATSYKMRNSAKFPKEPTWNMMYAFPNLSRKKMVILDLGANPSVQLLRRALRFTSTLLSVLLQFIAFQASRGDRQSPLDSACLKPRAA